MTNQVDTIQQAGTPISPPRRKRLRIVLVGIAILLCGMVIGSGLTAIVLHKVVVHAIHNPEKVTARIAARIKSKLNLNEDQADRVSAILTERRKAILSIRREAQPRVEAELDRLQKDVAAVLTPEQAASWNKRLDEFRRTWLPKRDEPGAH